MDLREALRIIGVEYNGEVDGIEISGISYDSRTVKAGDLFFAVTGLKADRHEFAAAAVENGAVAVVCERDIPGIGVPCIKVSNSRIAMAQFGEAFYGYPASKLKLIGVTGTKGKTTITHLIKSVLETAGYKCGLIGTNHNIIGDKVINATGTTPEAPELSRLFAEMVEAGCDYVVMEVSSHSLAIGRVAAYTYEVGAFSNLTHEHLDFHGNMDEYAAAKAKLFSQSKQAAINCDSKYAKVMAANCSNTPLFYGIENDCAVMARNIDFTPGGISFTALNTRFSLRIPGRFSVYNALCAVAVCHLLGINAEIIAKGLQMVDGVKGRVENIPIGRDFNIIIDYAHNPDSLQNILDTVKEFAEGRVCLVFGCGGDRDAEKRPVMGKIAGENADFCIVTSDNPRTENPAAIIREILVGMKDTTAEYVVIENRRAAIEYAIRNAKPKDTIILAGKGHETYQDIMGEKYHLDEREVIAEVLSLI